MSSAWEHDTLTAEQQQYAALDAFAALKIYQQLAAIPVPQPLPQVPVPSKPVLLYQADKTTTIARGQLSSMLSGGTFDTIKITKRHLFVEITKVHVPGTLVSSHRKRALHSFGAPPFSVVALCSHLRIYNPDTFNLPQHSVHPQHLAITPLFSSQMNVNSDEEDDDDDEVEADKSSPALSTRVGDLLLGMVTGTGEESNEAATQTADAAEAGPDSEAVGHRMFADLPPPEEWLTTVRSWVVKDPFHVFNMLNLPKAHGLEDFGRALRDVLFIPDQDD